MKNQTIQAVKYLADTFPGMTIFYKDGDTYTAAILDEFDDPILAVEGFKSADGALKALAKKAKK